MICISCGEELSDMPSAGQIHKCEGAYGQGWGTAIGRPAVYAAVPDYSLRQTPEYDWKIQLVPNTFWMVEKGTEPCWFHRKMQELLLGIKWIKPEKKSDT
tara:strand:+ start:1841 stop:2140 length:300 start_codon:yes stop_codon:yes gene_type:complete